MAAICYSILNEAHQTSLKSVPEELNLAYSKEIWLKEIQDSILKYVPPSFSGEIEYRISENHSFKRWQGFGLKERISVRYGYWAMEGRPFEYFKNRILFPEQIDYAAVDKKVSDYSVQFGVDELKFARDLELEIDPEIIITLKPNTLFGEGPSKQVRCQVDLTTFRHECEFPVVKDIVADGIYFLDFRETPNFKSRKKELRAFLMEQYEGTTTQDSIDYIAHKIILRHAYINSLGRKGNSQQRSSFNFDCSDFWAIEGSQKSLEHVALSLADSAKVSFHKFRTENNNNKSPFLLASNAYFPQYQISRPSNATTGVKFEFKKKWGNDWDGWNVIVARIENRQGKVLQIPVGLDFHDHFPPLISGNNLTGAFSLNPGPSEFIWSLFFQGSVSVDMNEWYGYYKTFNIRSYGDVSGISINGIRVDPRKDFVRLGFDLPLGHYRIPIKAWDRKGNVAEAFISGVAVPMD